VRIHRALDRFEVDPVGLDRARTRFSQSPPAYVSSQSGTPTRSASPVSEFDQFWEQRRTQLEIERQASLPYEQFDYETSQEMKWLFEAHQKRIQSLPPGKDVSEIANKNVKARWIEQGIWNEKWNDVALGLWKHEEPLEPESESEMDTKVDPPPRPSLFDMTRQQPQPKPRLPKSDFERRQIAERRVVKEQQRESSRPYQQLIYQVSMERERIVDETSSGLGAGVQAADINTKVYENVKKVWTDRGIWNQRWGILPGMKWKHEDPREEELAAEPAPISENHAGIFGCTEASAARIFGLNPPTESNPRQESGAMAASLQTPPKDIASDRLENENGVRSPSAPTSPPTSSGSRAHRLTTRQASRTGSTTPYHAHREAANASLGPIRSSKVSKTAGKKNSRPQRQKKGAQKISSTEADVVEAQPSSDDVTPRRSKWIQSPTPRVPKGPFTGRFEEPCNGAARSKPKRKVRWTESTLSSAKPQGISKKKSAKTTQRKSRKA
jgi:hypothetical protein